MKAKYLALSLLACVGMASCSDSDNLVGGDGQGSAGDINAAYLAVNINNVGTPGTSRADGDFVDGSKEENQVDKIRFYFFNSDGSPCTVDAGNSYKEVQSPQMDNENSDANIAKISATILVLSNISGQAPSTMVTVVNPPSSLTGNPTLTTLKNTLADYATSCTTAGTFVMSNSVYADGTTAVCETPVGAFLRSSQTAAEAAPVDVYVERVVAKVTVSFSDANKETNQYLVSGTADTESAIYAKVIGWGLVGTINKSYLLKNIDPSGWTTSLSGFNWNDALNHRSYWATTPSTPKEATIDNTFKYGDLTAAAGTSLYTQENTPTAAITDVVNNQAVKVVVAAQLVDKDGNAVPRIEYLGGTYASLNDVLNLIAPNFSQYWVKTDDTNYSQLRTQDLEFKSGASLGDGAASYYAYPQVKSGVTLYKKNNENSSYTSLTGEELATVNSSLKAYHALVWTNGKCYYTTTIQHLGTSGIPKYGVVRNHVYQVKITDIEGMGTPVYDPDNDEITPTVPKDENTYLAARVNVLAWKVVASDVTLSSGNN